MTISDEAQLAIRFQSDDNIPMISFVGLTLRDMILDSMAETDDINYNLAFIKSIQ